MINLEESATYQRILRKGEDLGQKKALTETLIRLLTIKLGKLPANYSTRIEQLDYRTLHVLIGRIFDLEKVEELKKYLY
ncbi:DUF4351 domain-containing protein [Heliorestis acidaminivorans]|uniref:DUF4351 domain-containing protein n=1 Tax=Heliorestis acidaminivorans TaxID=553427 RepID=A0A6I0F6F5_9FIRM|nr:DUF4351 domain-containing protein [Heliorestis acidaminivorans]KAB2952952.1 DUF4351 domain-containing protein [Heliorestis acidaminivorans]